MRGLISLLYLVFFLCLTATSFFILFHLSRYTINRRVASFAVLLFIAVSAVLLATNALLFFKLPFETLLPEVSGYSSFR